MQANKTTREKAIEFWNGLNINQKREAVKKHYPLKTKELGFNRAYLYLQSSDFDFIYLSEHPTPTEQVEGHVLEDWFYNNIDGDNAVVSDSIGFILEAPNEATGIELCKRYNGYPRLANRVKELEGQLQKSLLLYNNQVSNIEKLQGENEILREALQDIKRLTDNYRVMETLEGLDILCSHVNTKAKAALQQNK